MTVDSSSPSQTASKVDAPFSFEHRDGVFYVTGNVGGDEIRQLTSGLDAGEYAFDFDGVRSLNFAALRVLLNKRDEGIVCRISNASDAICALFDTTGISKFISVCRKPRMLDMTTVEHAGEGFTADSYNSIDGDSMVKLYNSSVAQSVPEREKRRAQACMLAGIPTPLAGDLVKVGDRNGLVFERVANKKSVARAIADDQGGIEAYAKKFAELSTSLHSTPCDKTMFPSVAAYYRTLVTESTACTEDERESLLTFLGTVPDTDTCVHGDLHFGNVIIADGAYIFIDMADFGYGNADFDLGALYFVCNFTPDGTAEEMFHFDNSTMRQFWKLFVRYYYGTDSAEDRARIESGLRPFAALRLLYTLSIGNITDCPPSFLRSFFD